jgi:hypothetical protein
LEDYTPQVKIYDVRDPDGKKDGIFLIGGFIGELIITFTCFMFSQDSIENYLKDLLIHENFADGILTLHLARDPTFTLKEKLGLISAPDDEEIERLDLNDDTFMRFSLTKSNITDYGLCFLFEVIKDLVISKEFIDAIVSNMKELKIARTKLKKLEPIPEMPVPDENGNEPSEEEK